MADKAADKPAREMKAIVLKVSQKHASVPAVVKTHEILSATKAAGKAKEMTAIYLIQRLCTFDGAALTAGEIMDLPAQDFAQINGVLFPDDDEDASGNA